MVWISKIETRYSYLLHFFSDIGEYHSKNGVFGLKHFRILPLLIFFFLSGVSSPEVLQASDNRIPSMGYLQLAIPDSDNQINFYDFGQNPAGLQADQKFRWMRMYINAQNDWGRYRRLYDPEEERDYSLVFEGVKAINSKETFWGSVTYLGDYPHAVYRSLEKHAYEKNFILTDTTTGNYWYNGPIIKAIYSRKLPLNFSLGLAFNYKVQMGLKNVYTKVESIQREIFPGIGLCWGVHEKARSFARITKTSPTHTDKNHSENSDLKYGAGIFVYPYDNKTRLTAVKEMQDAMVYRQIGIRIQFKQVKSTYVREYRTRGVVLGGQAFYSLSKALKIAFSHRYGAVGINTTDNLFVKRGFEQQIQNTSVGRMVFHKNGLQISAQASREALDDWSKTIEYGCLYGEDSQRRLTAGIGLGIDRKWLPITAGIEFYYGRFQRTYRDYLLHKTVKNTQPEWELRTGLEIPLFSDAWYVRLGGNWAQQVPDIFYLYKREKFWGVTTGLSWQTPGFRISFMGAFHSRTPNGSAFKINQPLFYSLRYIPVGRRRQFTFQIILQLFEK